MRPLSRPRCLLAVLLPLAAACGGSSGDEGSSPAGSNGAGTEAPSTDRRPSEPSPVTPGAPQEDATPNDTPAPPANGTFLVEGAVKMTCTFAQSFEPFQTVCTMTPAGLQTTPPLPAGAKLSDVLSLSSSSAPAAGWTTGLVLSKPRTAPCVTSVSLPAAGLQLTVQTQDAQGRPCGHPAGGLGPNHFVGGFAFEAPDVTYEAADGKTSKVKLVVDVSVVP